MFIGVVGQPKHKLQRIERSEITSRLLIFSLLLKSGRSNGFRSVNVTLHVDLKNSQPKSMENVGGKLKVIGKLNRKDEKKKEKVPVS